MDFLNNLLISVTVVAIFSAVILTVVGEDNSQRELVKISCGLLMIVVLLSGFNDGFMLDLSNFDDFYSQYEGISNNSIDTYQQIEYLLVKNDLEQLVLSQTDTICEISLGDGYEILKATIYDNQKAYEISQLLGISEDKIEYIESR